MSQAFARNIFNLSDVVFLSKTVHLTSAQILSLFDTPIELVPSPGSGRVLFIASQLVVYLEGTPYTMTGFVKAGYGTTWPLETNSFNIPASSFFGNGDQIYFGPGDHAPSGPYNTADVGGLAWAMTTTVENPSGGDGTFDVTTYYTIVDT